MLCQDNGASQPGNSGADYCHTTRWLALHPTGCHRIRRCAPARILPLGRFQRIQVLHIKCTKGGPDTGANAGDAVLQRATE